MRSSRRFYENVGVLSRRAAVFGAGFILAQLRIGKAFAINQDLIEATVKRIRLRKHYWQVGESMQGSITLHNTDGDTHAGNIFIYIFNDGVEASDIRFLQLDGDLILNQFQRWAVS